MATQPTPGGWTYERFARLPDDGKRYEVIGGELYVTPAPRPRHQRILVPLIRHLDVFGTQHAMGRVYPGPIDVLFAEGDYLEPDLIFIRHDRLTIVSERGVEGPPDLVVEILSESTAKRDRTIKRDRYAFFGVPEYWVVDPDKSCVEVYRLQKNATQPEIVRDSLSWQPLPDGPVFALAVKDLFAS